MPSIGDDGAGGDRVWLRRAQAVATGQIGRFGTPAGVLARIPIRLWTGANGERVGGHVSTKEIQMIYGYSKKVVNEYGLLQMREVSFAMSPTKLRVVATFLARVAEQLESGHTFLHRHIDEVLPEWRAVSSTDIIVVPQDSMEIPDFDS